MLANPRPDLGIMFQPGMQNATGPLAFWPWAADNGCFAQGERFDPGDWLEWLASMRRHRDGCLFAVAPDVIGDARATLDRSAPYLPTIRQLGFKAAYAAQNGVERCPPPWDMIDCLFVGGDDAFKQSEVMFSLGREAKLRGKWLHQGRVNSLRRLRTMAAALFDSADGTYVKYGPDQNLPRVYEWLDLVNGQTVLEAHPA